jgi:hypothetical protein
MLLDDAEAIANLSGETEFSAESLKAPARPPDLFRLIGAVIHQDDAA